GRDLDRLDHSAENRKLRERTVRRDPPDSSRELRKPERAIGTEGDSARKAPREGQRKLPDLSARSEAADAIGVLLGEPEIPVRTGGDVHGIRVGTADHKLLDGDFRTEAGGQEQTTGEESEIPHGAGRLQFPCGGSRARRWEAGGRGLN